MFLFSFLIGTVYLWSSSTDNADTGYYYMNMKVEVEDMDNASSTANLSAALNDVGGGGTVSQTMTDAQVSEPKFLDKQPSGYTRQDPQILPESDKLIVGDNFTWTTTNNDTQFEVCFVTSVYSSSVRTADRPPSVTDIQTDNPTFRFFAFTNLPDLVAPGWHIIVKSSPAYRRYITQSRWPKFMAWQHPLVQKCQAVFYMDGFCGPKTKHSERYKSLAHSIATSQFGLFQNVHDAATGPMHELDRIVALRKDVAKNVEASKAWLLSQPDFSDNCTMYANHYIAYAPRSVHFQRASLFFWDRYSMENDSWRDQPLWCYVLDHFQITPTRLGTFEALFRDYFGRMGHGGHRYSDKADNNTLQDQKPRLLNHNVVEATNKASAAEVCFVTASYSSSAENADRPPGVRKLLEANPTFRFFVFTNLPDLDAPGWTILVNNFTQYKRHITQSRWPKFLGWKHPMIQNNNCQAVFYQDAYCRPREKFAKKFKSIARQISESQYGIAQNLHEWGMGPIAEFDRILDKGKDTHSNVLASIAWLRSQPDFKENCTLYSNQYLAYDPSSVMFRKASQFLWDHYSLENDSWRDQPLWCYVLDKFNITPSDFGSFKTMFKEHKSRMSPNNHRYVNDS
jgi:hypothetical protein